MNPGVGWHLRRRVRGPHSLKLEGARFVGRSLRDAAARRGRRGTARGLGRGRRLMASGDRPRIGAPGRRSRRLGRGRVVLLPDPAPPRLRDRAWLSRGGSGPQVNEPASHAHGSTPNPTSSPASEPRPPLQPKDPPRPTRPPYPQKADTVTTRTSLPKTLDCATNSPPRTASYTPRGPGTLTRPAAVCATGSMSR